MKTTLQTILIFLSIALGYSLSAQNNEFLASTTCGKVIDIEPVDNGYMLLSQSHWAKLDSAGKVLNSRVFKLGAFNYFEDARFLADKGFIAVSPVSHNVACVVRLDSNGNEKWVKKYTLPSNYDFKEAGYNGYQSAMNISLARNGGYWFTGNLFDSVLKKAGGLIAKLDTSGNVLYTNMVLGDTNSNSNKWDYYGVGPVVYGPDGSNYFALGAGFFEDGNSCGLLKTDSLLNVKWVGRMENGAVLSKGMMLYKNQLYFASMTYNNTYYQPSMSINAYDTGGNWTSELSFNLGYYGNFNSIRSTRDSQLIALGSVISGRRANYVPMLVKTDLSLNLKWIMNYPTYPRDSIGDYGYDVKETRNGYILGGNHIIKTDTSGHSGCNDSAIGQAPLPYYGAGKLNTYFSPITIVPSNASVTSVVVSDKDSLICYTVLGTNDIKQENKEIKVFPNPSDGKFILQFSDITPISSIEIFNMLGERVATLRSPQKSNQYQIDLTGQPEGIYFYRITAEDGGVLGSGKVSIIR